LDVRVDGKRSQRGSETLDGAVDILSLKMSNITDFNSKVFELVVLQKQKYMSGWCINQSTTSLFAQSFLTSLWKLSSSSALVKKYVAAPHAVAAIAITNKTTNFERFTALVSALAILRLESLLTPPVWLVSVPEDREADSDERDSFSFSFSSLSLMVSFNSFSVDGCVVPFGVPVR
jgi:hypothetical protein